MTLENFPFPWGEESGVSQVLDEPALWALAFSGAGDADFRHAIKRAAKRTFRDLRILRVDDDEAFGAATIRLIGAPAGRAELKRQRLGPNLISIWLIDAIEISHGEMLPDLDEVAPKNDQGWRCIEPEAMRRWLSKNPLTNESRLAVSVILCAFAMGDQEDARTLAIELLGSDPAFASLLARNESISDPIVEDDTGRDGAEKAASVMPDETDVPITFETGNEGSELSDDTWVATLSLGEWRREIRQLRNKLGEESQQLDELDQLAAAVTAEGKVVATLPWLRDPLDLDEMTQLREGATGAAEQARLRELQTQLARVLRAHTQAEALTQRLCQEPARMLRGGEVSLDELATQLEAISAELVMEAEAIADIIKTARDLLDRLAAGDAGTAVEMAESAAPEDWAALAKTIFDPALNTSEMRDLRSALATDEVAGLLLARLTKSGCHAADDLVRWVFPTVREESWSARAEALFGFLSFTELCEVGRAAPSASEAAALLIFAAAIRRNRPDCLEHLTAFFDPGMIDGISREFYRVLLEVYHRGRLASPAANLREACAAEGEMDASHAAAQEGRQSLLVWLNSPPGMKKNFHKLRVFAQVQFLHPLRAAIEGKDSDDAWRQWQSFGSLEGMVNACIANLKKTDRPETRHYEQTKAYIEDFGSELERWVRLASAPATEVDVALAQVLETVRAEAPRNLPAAALLKVVEAAERVPFPASDFGERLEPDERIRMPRDDVAPWLSPTMLATWPRPAARQRGAHAARRGFPRRCSRHGRARLRVLRR